MSVVRFKGCSPNFMPEINKPQDPHPQTVNLKTYKQACKAKVDKLMFACYIIVNI